ncbi:MAG: helix-turn-helix transcriptional regulator, partial [Candidatus Nitrotoga sp.]
MDNPSENILSDASSNVDVRPFSVGAALREARERLGLSIADVESRLKFASRQIEALETDNFTRLPEIFFVRRFVRSYAKLLQLDPDPLLAALPIAPVQPSLHAASIAIEVPFPNTYATRRLKIIWLAIGLVAVMITLVLFVWLNRSKP